MDVLTKAGIAQEGGVSRTAAGKWVKRDFPPPVGTVNHAHPVWTVLAVRRWLGGEVRWMPNAISSTTGG
jgi:hypothetical protein